RLAAGRFLARCRRHVRRLPWRGRLELVHQVAQLPFEFEDLGLQLGDARLRGPAARTFRDTHGFSVAGSGSFSCARFRLGNGYSFSNRWTSAWLSYDLGGLCARAWGCPQARVDAVRVRYMLGQGSGGHALRAPPVLAAVFEATLADTCFRGRQALHPRG